MKPHNHSSLQIDVNLKKCHSRVKWNVDLILVAIIFSGEVFRKRFQNVFVEKHKNKTKQNKQQQQNKTRQTTTTKTKTTIKQKQKANKK